MSGRYRWIIAHLRPCGIAAYHLMCMPRCRTLITGYKLVHSESTEWKNTRQLTGCMTVKEGSFKLSMFIALVATPTFY